MTESKPDERAAFDAWFKKYAGPSPGDPARHSVLLWGVLWRSENKLDGKSERLLWDATTRLPRPFLTRAAARSYVQTIFAYLRDRTDLRAEPHGWKMPKVVRVRIVVSW